MIIRWFRTMPRVFEVVGFSWSLLFRSFKMEFLDALRAKIDELSGLADTKGLAKADLEVAAERTDEAEAELELAQAGEMSASESFAAADADFDTCLDELIAMAESGKVD